jgi:hypothetical protein
VVHVAAVVAVACVAQAALAVAYVPQAVVAVACVPQAAVAVACVAQAALAVAYVPQVVVAVEAGSMLQVVADSVVALRVNCLKAAWHLWRAIDKAQAVSIGDRLPMHLSGLEIAWPNSHL